MHTTGPEGDHVSYVRRFGFLVVLAVVLAACGTPTPPPVDQSTLTLTIVPAEGGTVTINGTAKTSGDHAYNTGQNLIIAATPAAGWSFDGFTGDCTGADCSITLSDDMAVTATFSQIPSEVTLSVSYLNGRGDGSVTSDVGGIACDFAATGFATDGTCAAEVETGTVVTLTATAGAASEFVGWSGDAASCGDEATCAVTVDNVKNAVARFSSDTEVNGNATIADTVSDAVEFVTAPTNTGYLINEVVVNTYELPLAYWYNYEAVVVSALRFANLSIPEGAVITDAYVQFKSNMNRSFAASMDNDPAPMIISGEASVNAATFTDTRGIGGDQEADPSTLNGITSRTFVPTTAAWSPDVWDIKDRTVAQSTADAGAPVPADLVPVLQAIVDIDGWTDSANAIVLTFQADPADADPTVGYRNAADFRALSLGSADGDETATLYFSYK